MELIVILLLFIAGFALLAFGADLLVHGSSSLARHLSISESMIGLMVVAFGTTAPELVVNIFASVKGSDQIVFGNVIGSNIFNTLFILGALGLFGKLRPHHSTIVKQMPFYLIITAVLFVLVNDRFFFGAQENKLSHFDGGFLLLGFFQFFIVYMIYTLAKSRMTRETGYANRIPDLFTGPTPAKNEGEVEMDTVKIYNGNITAIMIAGGSVLLLAGGFLVITQALRLSIVLRVNQMFLGLSLIAAGTSIPEFVIAVLAVRKNKHEITFANIIGANILNIIFVLALSALIRSAPYTTQMNVDLAISFVSILMLYVFIRGSGKFLKWQAGVFIAMYTGYLVFLCIRH